MGKKFVIYLKGGNRSITITDPKEDRSIRELNDLVGKMMVLTPDKLTQFVTPSDSILLRPSEIAGIHIQELLVKSGKLGMDTKSFELELPEDMYCAGPAEDEYDKQLPPLDEQSFDETTQKELADLFSEEQKEESKEELESPESEKIEIKDSRIDDVSKGLEQLLSESVEEMESKTKTEESVKTTPKEKTSATVIKKTVIGESTAPVPVSIPTIQEAMDQSMQDDIMRSQAVTPGMIDRIPHVGQSPSHIFQKDVVTPTPLMSGAPGIHQVPVANGGIDNIVKKARADGRVTSAKPIPIKK